MSTDKIKVAVLGGSGYTALELIKIFLRHPHVEIAAVTSRQEESLLVSDLHPSLLNRLDLSVEPFDPDRLQQLGIRCAFGCLPHGVSQSTLPVMLERGVRAIDLSADYRLRDPLAYIYWYGAEHHDRDNLARAVYGLPEVYRDEIIAAQLVANPGCYPQTAILGLAPLVGRQLIELNGIIVDSKSGVSGAGRTPKLHTHFPECNESVSAYNVGTHRHTPEIDQALTDVAGDPVEVIFTPHLIPMDRGIFTTIYAKPHREFTEPELLELFRDYYANATFVRVRDALPGTKDSLGTNYIDICPKVVRGKIVVLACEDNLVRGASGVAVQNFNLMFGFDETMGLV
jgi:N-acetyl-gamma-glutamyl-phosphate reductase